MWTRKLAALGIAAVAITLAGCSSPAETVSPWSDDARAYTETLHVDDADRVAAYLAAACANPNLSMPELAEHVGASWESLLDGGTISDFADAVDVGMSRAVRRVAPR